MIDEKKLIEDIEKEIEFAMKCNMPTMVAGMRQIASIIEDQPKVGEWIPCSERLPENETRVLVQWKKYFSDEIHIHILALNALGEWYCDLKCINGKAIAWQPLPEPYRPEKENNPEWKDHMMQTFLGGRR